MHSVNRRISRSGRDKLVVGGRGENWGLGTG